DRRHARHGFQPPLELVIGVAAQLGELAHGITLAHRRQRHAQDRLGRGVEAQQHRRLHLERKLQGLELVADFQAGLVHVRAPGELEHDVALAGAGNGLELAQPLDHAQGFLDRFADQGFHFHRCRTGVLGAHGQGRVAEVGQQVDPQVAQRDQPEQQQADGHHRHGHPAPRGKFNDAAARTLPRHGARDGSAVRFAWGPAHCRLPSSDSLAGWAGAAATAAPSAPITWTTVPSRRAPLPATTTWSPAARPSRISTNPASTWPSCTGERTATPSRTRYTAGSPSSSSRASRAMISTASRWSYSIRKRPNMPGCRASAPPHAPLTRHVPLPASTTGATRSTRPWQVWPGSASTCICTGWPGVSVASSRSGTLSVASRRELSTMRMIGVLICTKLPVLIEREAITPEIGAVTVV